MIRASSSIAAAVLVAATTCALAQDGFEPITRETLQNPPAGDWLMINRTYDDNGSARSRTSTATTSASFG